MNEIAGGRPHVFRGIAENCRRHAAVLRLRGNAGTGTARQHGTSAAAGRKRTAKGSAAGIHRFFAGMRRLHHLSFDNPPLKI